MKSMRRRAAAILTAERELYRSLCEEREKVLARLKALETKEIAQYIPPTYPQTADDKLGRKLPKD